MPLNKPQPPLLNKLQPPPLNKLQLLLLNKLQPLLLNKLQPYHWISCTLAAGDGSSMAERTGSPVFHTLWSYVLAI
jgi:hypothetical protein